MDDPQIQSKLAQQVESAVDKIVSAVLENGPERMVVIAPVVVVFSACPINYHTVERRRRNP